MKKIYLAAIAVLSLIPFVSKAQWSTGTDIHNTNGGGVGINTSTPWGKLQISSVLGVIIPGINLDPSSGFSLTPLQNSGNMLIGLNYSGGGVETDFITNRGGGGSGGFRFYDYTNAGSLNPLMTMLGNGNVGIGTTSPSSFLNLYASVPVIQTSPSAYGASDYSSYFGSLSTAVGVLQLGNSGQNDIVAGNTATGGYLRFIVNNSNNFPSAANGTVAMLINPSGNVGIGTASPTSFLHINGSEYAPATSGSTQNSNLRIGANSTGLILDAGVNSSATVPYSWLQSRYLSNYSTNYNLALNPNGGKVGIGTTSPDELLSVNGVIHSQEVKVDMSGWSDYVFKPRYTLPSLTSVKSYIDKNQHLPDIPSEQDVMKNGVNLGEMNKLLLKKVEELTLYLIEKDKQLNEQKKRLENIETRLNAKPISAKH